MLSLDVLKPHQPTGVVFAMNLADKIAGSCVELRVVEMDDKTETLQLRLKAPALDIDVIEGLINEMGASLHSVDEVRVDQGEPLNMEDGEV
jgi:hypothetical protein